MLGFSTTSCRGRIYLTKKCWSIRNSELSIIGTIKPVFRQLDKARHDPIFGSELAAYRFRRQYHESRISRMPTPQTAKENQSFMVASQGYWYWSRSYYTRNIFFFFRGVAIQGHLSSWSTRVASVRLFLVEVILELLFQVVCVVGIFGDPSVPN